MSHIAYIHIYPKTKRFLKHIKKSIITCLDSCVYFFHVGAMPSCWCVLNHDCQALASVFVGNSKTKRKNNTTSNGFLLLNYWKVSILRKWSTLHLPYAHVAHIWSMKCIPTSKRRSFVPLQTLTESCSALVLQIWHRQIFRNFNGDKNLHAHNIRISAASLVWIENLMLRFASCK